MAGYATLAEIKADLATETCFRMSWSRLNSITKLGGRTFSWWPTTGVPAAGTYPAAGLGSAVALDKTTAGALNVGMPDAASGQKWWFLRALFAPANQSATPASTAMGGAVIFYDRLAHATVAVNQSTGSFSPTIDGTARLASGEGALIFAEAADASAVNSGNVFTLDYTDQGGSSGTTAQVTVGAVSAGRPGQSILDTSAGPGIWIPLAAGDTGARTITGWTLVSGSASGNIAISLCKPIAMFSLPAWSCYGMRDVDWIAQLSGMGIVHDDACVAFLALVVGPNVTNAYDGGEVILGMK